MQSLAINDRFSIILSPENRRLFDFSDGALYRRHGSLEDPAGLEHFVGGLSRLLAPVWERRSTLTFLDAGSGFGLTATALASLGARWVYGIEVNPACRRTCRAIEDAFPELGVQFLTGRPEALPLARKSVDVVLALESISRFVEPWRFLEEAWRVLRPGGLIAIAEPRQSENLFRRRRLHPVWDRLENGPRTEELQAHWVKTPFREARRDLLRDRFPQAAEADLIVLSYLTSGLWGESLVEVARRYLEQGELPSLVYRKGVCPVDPASGAFPDNFVSTREVARFLRGMGASLHLGPRAVLEARTGLAGALERLLGLALPMPVGLRVLQGFHILAVKPAEAEKEQTALSAFLPRADVLLQPGQRS